MSEVTITKDNFKNEVLEAEKPVLIDFWADWCMPCKMMSPVVATFAEENPEIKVCKCNVDEQPELAEQFQVMSIPFLALFKNGKLEKATAGYMSVDMLKNFVTN